MRHSILAILILSAALIGCGNPPADEPLAKTESAVSVGSPLCVANPADPNAVYPWNATYPLGSQHVWCQHQIAETNPWQWPTWASPCIGSPGFFQVDVFTQRYTKTNIPSGEFCTRVTIPGPLTWPLKADYIDTMSLGWLATSPRRNISKFLMGPSTNVIMSSLPDVGSSGCVPTSACINYVNGASGAGNPPVQVQNLMTAYSWMMQQP